MKPTVYNHTDRDLSKLTKTFNSFEEYARKKLNYDKPFTLNFRSDPENNKNMFGKTAYYDPSNMDITIFVDNRHNKDMLRSISHEMVHHTQNCRGDFDNTHELGEGYAQKDPHLRSMEAEAYLIGNGFLVRDFEDAYKLGDIVLMEWKRKKTLKKVISLKEAGTAEQDKVEAIEKHWNIIIDKDERGALKSLWGKLRNAGEKIQDQFVIQLLETFGFPESKIKQVLLRVAATYEEEGQEGQQTEPGQEGQIQEPAPTKVTPGVREHYRKRNQRIGDQVFERFMRRK